MALLIFFSILLFCLIVLGVILSVETEGVSIIWSCIACLLLWALVENKSTDYDKPIVIPIENLSILIDSEVAIIRHETYHKIFKSASDYNAIKDSSFTFTKSNEYDVFGEDNGCTYNFEIIRD